jgi:hypothetical protein
VLKSLLVLVALVLAVPITALAMDLAEPAADAARALPAPRLDTPGGDANVQSAPVFTWKPVRRAARYEFQLSDDSGFRSIVTGGSVPTMNTAFTLEHSLPDGTYFWRVRAVNAKDDAGRWSHGRSFTKRWSNRPTLLGPTDGTVVKYPTDPLVLRWEPVPHAVKYVVTVAADPALASQVWGSANDPIETVGTAVATSPTLEPGQYWWAITPENAVGHRGARSAIGTFTWEWPSTTSVQVNDLNADPRVYDPQFSWNRVPGAARYEVEVNSSEDFAVGSKVCCADKTVGTSLSPAKLFPNNTYFWRMRALDPGGKSGVWNVGTPFQKVYDPVDPTVPALTLRDNHGVLATPAITTSPIVTWDPVPGAASYDVQVVPFVGGCNWSSTSGWQVATATTAWTALASGGSTPVPPKSASNEFDKLDDGDSFCVRVRARTGTSTNGSRVFSEWTYLGGLAGPAFTYDAPAGPVSNTKVTADASDYIQPLSGTETSRAPLFTWEHIDGACGYFIVVAKDAEFTTIVDVARTKIPAYAPRKSSGPLTYPDETTSYYWVVIPVVGTSCTSVFSVIGENNPHDFRKESTPPPPIAPAPDADVTEPPTFAWGDALGARDYRLQVAHDPSFGSLIDDVVTASTAYTSSSTYPADALLYWRVRANDETNIGLNWSATQSFRRRLPTPVLGTNLDSGERIPIFSWDPVPGAVSYDLSIEEPDGDNNVFSNLPSTAAVPDQAYGLGTWQWRVRANFPAGGSGTFPGPFSARRPWTRFMNPPTGAHATRDNGGLVLRWDPSYGLAKNYRVEFSESNGFGSPFDSKRVDNDAYAPTLTATGFQNGGPVYWRLAAVDEGGNVGGWATGRVGLLRKMVVSANGGLQRGTRGLLEVRVMNARGRAVRRARVTLRGVGVRARKRTSKRGLARFRVRPRARGTLKVRADKRGFRPGSAIVTVR